MPPDTSLSHGDVLSLLPWYVSGRIDVAEKMRLDAHLAECAECRAELDAEQELSGAVATLSLDAERDWSRMRQKLFAETKDREPRSWGFWPLIGGLVAAQAAAVLLFIVATGPRDLSNDLYRTLSAPRSDTAAPQSALVIFRPDTTERALREAVMSIDGRITDGPTDADAYVVQFDGPPTRRLSTLKRHPAVLLAEPIR